MKTKETIDSKTFSPEQIKAKAKAKSLRPMRSMVAVRSLKPKTAVANLLVKSESAERRI